ncbi:hypothetical protein GCM10007862_08650 [Dyella lipolytica]|nr:hypothetical protein GCM10007862_08650 [Dyella lipolytica]
MLGSAHTAKAVGVTRNGRVHIRANALSATNFQDLFLLGHEIAHAIQHQRGVTLPWRTLDSDDRAALEAEADDAGMAFARGKPFEVKEQAPLGAALFRNPQKILRMTLLRERGVMILDLQDGTKESLKLYYNGKPDVGDYQFDVAKSNFVGTDANATPNAAGLLLEFWRPLDADFDASGIIPIKVVSSSSVNTHRIQARPELSEALPGTKITYAVEKGAELGAKYQYKWWCENDPSEAQRLGKPLFVYGPNDPTWDTVWGFPGRHTVVCELTDLNTQTTEKLEFYQKVRSETEIVDEAFDKTKAPNYDRFRAGLELKNLELMQGAAQDQSGDGKIPFVTCTGQNPAVPGRPPDYANNTYTITPSPSAKKFRWYVVPEYWDLLPTQSYLGFNKVNVRGVAAYDLAKDGKSADFVIADARVWTVYCDELDGSGQLLGTTASYRQVILSQAKAGELAKWRDYMKKTDAAMAKIADGKEVGIRAAYVNRETGQTMPLQLYVGPSAEDPKKVVLLDLLPGVDKVEYGGDSIDAALADFDTNNAYPKGTIKLQVLANPSGIPTRSKSIETKGESDWALWSSRVGWASLGLTVAGVVAAAVPGGQPVAAVLFIAAGATGVTAGGLSLYDRLQKAQKSPVGIALDIAGIAGSMIGASSAIRMLRAGSQAVALTSATGRFLLYSGFVTNAVSGLLISVEGVDQIIKILDSPMSRGEKLSALVRVLGTLVLQGILFALSVREVSQMRTRVGSLINNAELSKQLPAEVLQSLNLLDDNALRALAGATTVEQITQVAKIARLDPRLANRLALLQGRSLAEHEITLAGGVISLDGQIKIDARKLASMTDEEVKKLMQATKALKTAAGDLKSLNTADKQLVDELSKSAGQRLRFEAQLKKVDQFLNDIGAKTDARGAKLLGDISDAERRRLYDLVNANRPGTGNLEKQASDYALAHATSANEYVELFEAYAAKFKDVLESRSAAYETSVSTEVQKRIAANPAMTSAEKAKLPGIVQKQMSKAALGEEIDGFGPRFKKAMAAKVENELGQPGDPTRAGSGATQTQATLDANKLALRGRIGAATIDSGLSDVDAMAKVKALPEVKFGSETAASYHVEKHVGELPPSELSGNRVSDFLKSANKTIQSGTASVKVNQDGSRNIIYTRQMTDAGKSYTMTAMVNVSWDGKVSLATYMTVSK